MANDVKDYSTESMDNSHYSVPSMYGKMCREQYNLQPRYCEPGKADGEMRGEKRNEQAGP